MHGTRVLKCNLERASKPRVRRPAERLARGRGDVREQLLGVGAGLGVGVCEPPARAEQLAQHGRHVPVALTRATLPLREGGAKLLRPRSRLGRGHAERQRLCEQLRLMIRLTEGVSYAQGYIL